MKVKLHQTYHLPTSEYLQAFFFTSIFLYTIQIQTHLSSATQLVITCLPPPYCSLHHCEDFKCCDLLNKCHYVCVHEDDEDH
jgi:hypothetical protein